MVREFDDRENYGLTISEVTHRLGTSQEIIDKTMMQLMQENIDMLIPRGHQRNCVVMLRDHSAKIPPKSMPDHYSWIRIADGKEGFESKKTMIEFCRAHPGSVLKGLSDSVLV